MADSFQRKYTQFYQEKMAKLYMEHDIPLVGYRRITRAWLLNEMPFEIQSIIAELNTWTSEKNTSPLKYVDDPGVNQRSADGEPFTLPGRWRLEVNRTHRPPNEKPGIYQELAAGYLQPPTDPLQWPKIDQAARITKVTDWTASGKSAILPYFIVTYPNVAQETVQNFVNALVPRGTLVNPKFDDQVQLTGSYRFSAVKNEEQEDGSSFVMATLVNAVDPGGLSVLFANNCGNVVTRTIYMGVSFPPTVPTGSSGVEYFVRDFSFDINLGMYSLQIEQVSQNTLTAGVVEQSQTDIERIDAQDFLGVRNWVAGTNSGVDQTGASVPVFFPGNPTPGLEYTQEIEKNANCTVNVRQKKRTVKNLAAITIRKLKDLFHTQVATSNKADAAALPDPAVPAGGVVQTTESVKNGLGQFDTTLTTTTEIAVTAATTTNTKTVFDTTATTIDKSQNPATSLTASAASGTIIEKRGEKTPGAMLDVTTTTKVELPVTDAVKDNEATIFQTVARHTDKAQSLATDLSATAVGGVITNKQGIETPGGLRDVVVSVITETSVTSAAVETRVMAFETTADTTNRNQVAAAATPTLPGQTVVNSKTPGGSYDQKLTTITPVAVSDATHQSSSTAFEITSSTTDRNQVVAATPVTAVPAAGILHVVESQENELGKFDNTVKTITEQNVASASVLNVVTAIQTETQVIEKGASPLTDLTASLDANTHVIIQKQGVVTPGKFLDVTVTTKTPVPSLRTVTLIDKDGPETFQYFKHKKTADVQTLLDALSPYNHNTFYSLGGMNEHGLMDGHIHSKSQQGASSSFGFLFQQSGLIEDTQHEAIDHTGIHWLHTDTSTFTEARGVGTAYGASHYSGAGPGSIFHKEGSDGFYYRKVTRIDRTTSQMGHTDSSGNWIPGAATSGISYNIWIPA